jgi:hypothetical protein
MREGLLGQDLGAGPVVAVVDLVKFTATGVPAHLGASLQPT